MARVFIGVGHGGSDPGAVGHVVEKDAALTIALAARAELQRYGVTVGISRTKDEEDGITEEVREANAFAPEKDAALTIALAARAELQRYGVTVGISRTKDEEDGITEEVREANAFAPDIAIEIHVNAGGGDGFEAYVQTNRYAAASLSCAKAVERQVIAMGQNSRGSKPSPAAAGTTSCGCGRCAVPPCCWRDSLWTATMPWASAAPRNWGIWAGPTPGACWTFWGSPEPVCPLWMCARGTTTMTP